MTFVLIQSCGADQHCTHQHNTLHSEWTPTATRAIQRVAVVSNTSTRWWQCPPSPCTYLLLLSSGAQHQHSSDEADGMPVVRLAEHRRLAGSSTRLLRATLFTRKGCRQTLAPCGEKQYRRRGRARSYGVWCATVGSARCSAAAITVDIKWMTTSPSLVPCSAAQHSPAQCSIQEHPPHTAQWCVQL